MPRKPIRYEFTAEAGDFEKGARRAEDALQGIARQAERTENSLDLHVDVDDSAISTLRRRLVEARIQLERDIKIEPDVDVTVALAKLRTIERQLKQLDRMDVKPEVNIDKDGSLSRFTTDTLPDLVSGLPMLGSGLSSVAAAGPAGAVALAAIAVAAADAAAVIGTAAGGGLIAALVGGGAYSLLGAYDQLDKANRKVSIVFGDQADDIRDWAKGLSSNIGVGTKEIEAGAAAIQDLLVPRGFKRKDAAEITKGVYARGAALAEFNGVETAAGVEAVNAALLGQRKQLKGLGVDITAKEVKERATVLKSDAAYKGFNEKQLETVATMTLIEEKSSDAWTAFNEGGSAADTVLDTLNSTLANLKTDAIEGFGGIFVGIVEDLMGAGDALEGIDLASWIEDNRDKIREAMLDIVDMALTGAGAFIDFAKAVTTAMIDTTPMLAAQLRVLGGIASALQLSAGAAMLLVPGLQGFGVELIKTSDNAYNLANAAATSAESFATNFGPDILKGLETASGTIDTFQSKVRDLKNLDETRLRLRAEIVEGDKTSIQTELKAMSKDELVAFIARVDKPNADETDKELATLAKERLATIKVEAENAEAVRRAIDEAARDRIAIVTAKFAPGWQIDSPSRPRSRAYTTRAVAAPSTYYSIPTQQQFERSVRDYSRASSAASGYPDTVILQGVVLDPDNTARALERVLETHYSRTGRT